MQRFMKSKTPGILMLVVGLIVVVVAVVKVTGILAPGVSCGGPTGLPLGGVWQTGAPMLTARAETAAIQIGDKIYVAGGMVKGWVTTTVNEIYDTVTNTWTTASPAPYGIHHAGVAAVNGKVYVIGGYDDMGKMVNAAPDIAHGWVYDPAADTWNAIADMPSTRAAGSAVTIDDKIFVVGGTGTGSRDVWVYDPATDTWDTSRTGKLPVETEHVPAVTLDGKIYVIGGRWNNISTPAVQVYDVQNDTWERKADIPVSRSALSLAVLDGKIHAVGGEELSNKCTYALHEEYDPATDTWTELADMPTGRHAMFSGVVNNRWYLIGGSSEAGSNTERALTGVVEIFEPNA